MGVLGTITGFLGLQDKRLAARRHLEPGERVLAIGRAFGGDDPNRPFQGFIAYYVVYVTDRRLILMHAAGPYRAYHASGLALAGPRAGIVVNEYSVGKTLTSLSLRLVDGTPIHLYFARPRRREAERIRYALAARSSAG